LFSYANGGFDVDMTIECRDVLGEFISIKDISGETKKWRKNALTALGNGECTRLDLIANLISPQIEEFAKSVYEELEKRDANYWEQLIEARDAKVAEKRQTSRLAVMELKTRDVERETANSITDAIRDTLRSECESDVLSRRDMLTAIHSDEVLTDCFAADCWQDVSNKLDVQSIVLVRMEMSGKSYQLVLNLVDTETLEIEKTVTEDCVTELSLLPTARTAAKRLMIEPEPSVDEDEEDEDEEGQDEGAVEDEAEDKDD
ncbi:MAG: hypothetical protein JW941_03910, partial [Candidatus Coatesbacteria bacterium]|nr:hypothetical protein [Candidatus Coatesbacteria bacterium]